MPKLMQAAAEIAEAEAAAKKRVLGTSVGDSAARYAYQFGYLAQSMRQMQEERDALLKPQNTKGLELVTIDYSGMELDVAFDLRDDGDENLAGIWLRGVQLYDDLLSPMVRDEIEEEARKALDKRIEADKHEPQEA